MMLTLVFAFFLFATEPSETDPTASWPTCSGFSSSSEPPADVLRIGFNANLKCESDCVSLPQELNGSSFAHFPKTTSDPVKCQIGEPCTVCFDGTPSNCITTSLGKLSQKKGLAEFSPATFDKFCETANAPEDFRQYCTFLKERPMKATIYSDGYSCPEGCLTPHVVFHKVHNGTARAFLPTSSAQNPEKCVRGKICTVCFKEATECLSVKYMGSGPAPWRLDFPPAFYREQCPKADIPETLRAQCDEFQAKADSYLERLNCFENTSDPKCVEILKKAETRQKVDAIKRRLCLKVGQKEFNSTRPIEEQRIYSCNYSKQAHEWSFPNHERQCVRRPKWKMLLPGACPQGTFVGKYGLNCCGKDLFSSAAVGPGCAIFFPLPEEAPL